MAELAAPPSRVWRVWADVRQLERWWGPPTWPATSTDHDVVVGGTSRCVMTGPEQERAHGWWRVLAVDEPTSLELDEGSADETGAPDPQMPTTRMRLQLQAAAGGTRMTLTPRFATAEQMQQLVDMGMVEGMTEAVGQTDQVLAGA